MTHDDEHDIDIDTQEDFDTEAPARASLKETWDSNPMLKVGAVVLGIVLLAGGYMIFFGGQEKDVDKSVIAKSGSRGVKTIVGKTPNDPIYKQELIDANKKRAEEAKAHGQSSISTPVGMNGSDALALPAPAPTPADDPLREWRRRAEMQRTIAASESVPDQPAPPAPLAPVKPITPVQQERMDPNAAKALASQMRVIIGAQKPKNPLHVNVTHENSAYVDAQLAAKQKQTAQAQQAGGNASDGGTGSQKDAAKPKLIVSAGSVAYAQLLTELNSDVPSPALAIILSGPFEGGKALGQFSKQDEYLTLTFTRIVKDGITYSINGIALDENTTLPAQQSDVNHHYFQRIVLPAAAAFLTGYTSAVAQTSTTTTTTSGGGVATDQPAPDDTEAINAGLSSASNTVAGIMQQNASRPVTVIVHKGTTMGVLFLDTVTTASARQ
jgi:intracellular multiplication protein IcmE